MSIDKAILERGEILLCFRVGGKVVAKTLKDDGSGEFSCVASGNKTFEALAQLWDRLKEQEKK